MSGLLRVVVSRDGTITRACARDLNARLRTSEFTGGSLGSLVCELLDGLEISYARVSATDLTPAQKGAYTRKTNARKARKAARGASTGYVRAQIAARRSA